MKTFIKLFLLVLIFVACAASGEDMLLSLFRRGNMPAVAEVLLVLDRGADVTAREEEGRTALMFAVGGRQVKELISSDPVASSARYRIFQPKEPVFRVVEELLIAGADVNAQDNKGMTALMYAATARKTSAAIVNHLLQNGAAVNIEDNEGMTALLHAVANLTSDNEIVHMLLQADSSIKHKDNSGRTAILHAYSAQNFNEHVAALLLEAGSEINMTDKKGASILIDNLSRGLTPEGLQLLAQAEFDFTLRSSRGSSLLHHVFGLNDVPRLYEVFAQAGVDIDEPDANGNRLLMRAAIWGRHRPGIIKTLARLGADPDAKNAAGDTALLAACRKTSAPEIVADLIDVGASPFIKDAAGYDALTLARRNKNLAGSEALMALEALVKMQQ